jgi:hypothetical protein
MAHCLIKHKDNFIFSLGTTTKTAEQSDTYENFADVAESSIEVGKEKINNKRICRCNAISVQLVNKSGLI